MNGVTNNRLAELHALRAAQLHKLALSQAMFRMGGGRAPAVSSPSDVVASVSLEATLAALNAETTANERAIDIAETAGGAVGEISALLTQARSLVTSSADTTLGADERSANQLELDSILGSIDRLSSSTSFGETKLLDGSFILTASGRSIRIESTQSGSIGTTSIDGEQFSLSDIRTGGAQAGDGAAAVAIIDAAINDVATIGGAIGAFSRHALQPRLNEIAGQRAHLLATVAILRETEDSIDVTQVMQSGVRQRLGAGAATHPKPLGGMLDIRA